MEGALDWDWGIVFYPTPTSPYWESPRVSHLTSLGFILSGYKNMILERHGPKISSGLKMAFFSKNN